VSGPRRRRFLVGIAASLAALSGAGRVVAAETPGSRVRLGFVGTPCEAATFSAPGSALFRGHGLDARLVSLPSELALAAALSAGAVDAASINLPALLQPLESGLDVRVVAGLHAGCLRVVAPEAVIYKSFGNLKGASIAVDRLHSPSMNLLTALVRRQGIDPRRDISWHVYAPEALDAALDAKQVDCVAAADPLAYGLLAEKKVVPYLNTADGGFTCGDGIGRGHHCFLALSGRFVRRNPSAAGAVTRAYLASTAAIGRGVGPAALAESRGAYTDADMYSTIAMLSSYDWSPTTQLVLEEIELTARDFRRAGLLKTGTDPEHLADRAFAAV
jgi:NitT/TauT family transport system substrate-binding protein